MSAVPSDNYKDSINSPVAKKEGYGSQPTSPYDHDIRIIPSKKELNESIITDSTPPKYRYIKPAFMERVDYSSHHVLNTTVRTQGEYPDVPFEQVMYYRDNTPHLEAASRYTLELIVGSGIIVTCDDEEVEELCQEFIDDIDLDEKIRNIGDQAYTLGFALGKKVFNEKNELTNIEEFDTTRLTRIHRDQFGNPTQYVYHLEVGAEIRIFDVDDYIQFKLIPRGRKAYGKSFFHSLLLPTFAGERTFRPRIEQLWGLTNALYSTHINYISPASMVFYDGMLTADKLREEGEKIRALEPGERIIGRGLPPTVVPLNPIPPSGDPAILEFIQHEIIQATGFPYQMLVNNHGSRASSETTNVLLDRYIRKYQAPLLKIIKQEIIHLFLKNHSSKKWDTVEKVKALKIKVNFDTRVPHHFTPEQVAIRVEKGIWTVEEARQYDRDNGQKLANDDDLADKTFKDKYTQEKELAKIKGKDEKKDLNSKKS